MSRYKSSKPHKRNKPAKRGSQNRHRNDALKSPDQATKNPSQGEQVEGRQAVRELLIAQKRKVHLVYIAEDQDRSEILDDIKDLAGFQSVAVKEVSKKKLEAESQTSSHQGVIARAAPLEFVSLDSLMAVSQPFILVLDGVTDPQNFGSILRVAECAGVTGIVITERRSVRVTPTVTKTAAGSVEHVPICRVGGIPSALLEMDKAGVLTVGLDAAGETSLFDPKMPLEKPIAVVMGREGSGLSKLVRQKVAKLLSIPLLGELNSLNVSTATAIACFEVVRRGAAGRE